MELIEIAGWVALGFVPVFTVLEAVHIKLRARLYQGWISDLEAKTFDL
jgi:hypothetical protein